MSTSPAAERQQKEWTIRALLEWTERHFQQKGLESPKLEAQLLLAHALNCRRTELYVRWNEVVDEECRSRFRDLIRKRLEGCPVHYLLGRREFFLLTLEVTPDVLIPRPETELLVTEALRLLKPRAAPRVLDVGTGSGCIALAIAQNHPTAVVAAVDISPEAVLVAQRNAQRLRLDDRVRFLIGDLLEPVRGETFDLIASNPPYIAADEWSQIASSVRDFEPRIALDGGADGFAVYDRLIPQAAESLTETGILLLEIGYRQELGVQKRLEAAGMVCGPALRDDLRLPRVMVARKSHRR
jgi:release factor glutamine methyltransferase